MTYVQEQGTTVNSMTVNRQWASRPDDQRFTSMHDLQTYLESVKTASRVGTASNRRMTFGTDGDLMNGLIVKNDSTGEEMRLSNWAFSQACQAAGATHSYLSKLPAALAADCLNYGFKAGEPIKDFQSFSQVPSAAGLDTMLKALTTDRYNRVYSADFNAAIMRRIDLSAWTVPGIRGKALEKVTKQDTTLYASDRDYFIFLSDETNRIELPNRRDGKTGTLARGFLAWNSEVGSTSIGMASFLYDFACANRIIWGLQSDSIKEIRFRHVGSVQDRVDETILPYVKAYSQASVSPMQAKLIAAQNSKLDNAAEWLASRYGKGKAASYMTAHQADEGRPIESLWDVATAITAAARTIPFANERIIEEREAGKVLDLVAA